MKLLLCKKRSFEKLMFGVIFCKKTFYGIQKQLNVVIMLLRSVHNTITINLISSFMTVVVIYMDMLSNPSLFPCYYSLQYFTENNHHIIRDGFKLTRGDNWRNTLAVLNLMEFTNIFDIYLGQNTPKNPFLKQLDLAMEFKNLV